MTDRRYDVAVIGNALVDVLAHEDEAFIAAFDLARGAATMVDADTSARVYDAMGPAVEMSGGSAANTAAGIASLGGRVAFVGKVHDDEFGRLFSHDLRATGVDFDIPPASDGPPTGRCLVVVTPDAERTMCTYLGAAADLTTEDIDEPTISSSRITYVEGYLWDPPEARMAIRHAMEAAHASGGVVAFTLSDPFCVARHRADFLTLLDGEVDVLFANEHEIRSLFEVESFEDAAAAVRSRCPVSALTRSERGSVVLAGADTHVVGAEPVPEVVDVTGAGDLYAAGFLYGLSRDLDLTTCARLGSIAAAEVIQHLGARPLTRLRELVIPHLG